MTILRTIKNKNYTIMSNVHLRDKGLSLKAKGLLSVMLSLPDDWEFSIAGLVAISKENETAIKSALDELKERGYLVVNKLKPSKKTRGKFGYQYLVFETPDKGEQAKLLEQAQGGYFLGVENQGLEFLGVENRGQLNTNLSNTNILKDERKKDKADIRPAGGFGYAPLPSLTDTERHDTERKEPTQEEMDQQARKASASVHPCTRYLIAHGIISENDPHIPDFNSLYFDAIEEHGFDLVRDVNNYVVRWMLKTREKIQSPYAYFRSAFLENLEMMEKRMNMDPDDLFKLPPDLERTKTEDVQPRFNWFEQ